MKHYVKLLELGCFSKQDLERITGSEAAAKWLCLEYQKKGYIERVKRDLYVAISLETQQPIASRYVIASHISDDAAVSYHSAFEFYGYSNQVFYETQVTSESRFRDFEYDGVTYRRIAPRITGGITEINGVRVTTLERTVIDSINLFEKIGGLEELLRCLALIPALDEAALSTCLAEYGSGFLYQKTGYILSAFASGLGLSDGFFDMCQSRLPKGKSYLSSESQGFIRNEKWKLYAPKNLIHLIDKGVTDYDAIRQNDFGQESPRIGLRPRYV
jgi:predicted transcriptional regulator of viral defense system